MSNAIKSFKGQIHASTKTYVAIFVAQMRTQQQPTKQAPLPPPAPKGTWAGEAMLPLPASG